MPDDKDKNEVDELNNSVISENDEGELQENGIEYLGAVEDDEEEEDYSLEDDGLKTYKNGGFVIADDEIEEKNNYNNLPNFKFYRDDYSKGDNFSLNPNDKPYLFNDYSNYDNENEINLVENCYERLKKNLKLDDLERNFSVSSYKKALLKSLESKEYTHYYIDEVKTYNIFDSRNYVNLALNLRSAFDKDLNGTHRTERLKEQNNFKKNNDIDLELIHNQSSYEGSFKTTKQEFRSFNSISSAIDCFRKMEAYSFNRIVGGGEAKYASLSVLNQADYRNRVLNYDLNKIKEMESCITDEEITKMYVKSLNDSERKELYDGIRSNMAFMNKYDDLSTLPDKALSSEKLFSVLESIKSLTALQNNNKSRFFLNRWFSTSSSEEKFMISEIKTGLKEFGLTNDEIQKIQNNDKTEISRITESLIERNDIYVEKYGYISHDRLIEKLNKENDQKLNLVEKKQEINKEPLDINDFEKEEVINNDFINEKDNQIINDKEALNINEKIQ